ncbi:MAG: GNAT family N-acetyltransferase [Candidatus Delongbacteria bacterium]|nr:GNAT family N-acetyltransferase [Candidatus Delongbacteria bacterium]MBN2834124.1 GNAT family N-acetyltransferase [Candidatus Delongbacteria bacterium]
MIKDFPRLETERTILVEIKEDCSKDLFEIYGNDEVMKYMQSKTLVKLDDMKEKIRNWQEMFRTGKGYRWAIKLKDSGKIIGTIALHYWDFKNSRIELGADINPFYQGRGLASEVTKKVIAYGFENLKVHRMELRCDPRNIASIKIAEKLGFVFEGTLRDYVYIEGKGFLDESVYSFLRDKYVL